MLIARFLHLLALLLGSSLRFLPGASLNLVAILYTIHVNISTDNLYNIHVNILFILYIDVNIFRGV